MTHKMMLPSIMDRNRARYCELCRLREDSMFFNPLQCAVECARKKAREALASALTEALGNAPSRQEKVQEMSDDEGQDWLNNPSLQAAAFEGIAENRGYSMVDRLQAAIKAISLLREALSAKQQENENLASAIEDLKRANDSLWPIVDSAETVKAAVERMPSALDSSVDDLLKVVGRWQEESKRLYTPSQKARYLKALQDLCDMVETWYEYDPNVPVAAFHGTLDGKDAILADALATFRVLEGDGFNPHA